MSDPFDLERFVQTQNPVFDSVLAELREGRKRGHWMWFIFPQLRGLGSSAAANHFGIASRTEAAAYLKHPLLGPRLRECTELVSKIAGRSIEAIFGGIDAMKFRSCMTLFAAAGADCEDFERALEKYFSGKGDEATLERLA